MVDIKQEVKDDTQFIYTKMDVIELLEKQQEQMIEQIPHIICLIEQGIRHAAPYDMIIKELTNLIKKEDNYS